MKVDKNFKPIPGTETHVECDALILSVGLIPENELAESLKIKIDPKTKGPIVDNNLMTDTDGIFSCGNALHVNDLVDYVSESGEIAGKSACKYIDSNCNVSIKDMKINVSDDFLYMVPQNLNLNNLSDKTDIYFRSKRDRNNVVLKLLINGKDVYEKKYQFLRPPEMEKIILDFNKFNIKDTDKIEFIISEARQ